MNWNKSLILVTLLFLTYVSFAQKTDKESGKLITISGKVTTSDKSPVAGAVLYIDNLKTNNITSSNGSYKIKVSSSATFLEVRSDLYGNSELPINGQKVINFTLGESEGQAAVQGNKALVKRDSISNKKHSGTRAKKMNTYNDIFQMIRAEVTGVIVNGRSVQIQQGHSFFGSGTPLFVINGVIVNSIDDVNPIEVKSIRVLKGSQAAIYGVRGSNGVISITLKNGTEKENN